MAILARAQHSPAQPRAQHRPAQHSPLEKAAREMVRLREVIEPRPDRTERLLEAHLRLVDALEQRGWLPAPIAQHARRRAEK